MIWEATDKACKTIELAKEKILVVSDGWYIESVIGPDRKNGKDINSLTLTVKRDISNGRDCETCVHYNEWPRFYCDECSRNWEDNYKEG